jgi:hypothetical protein
LATVNWTIVHLNCRHPGKTTSSAGDIKMNDRTF